MFVVHCTACPHCTQFGAATGAVSYALHAVVQPCSICILHIVDSVNAKRQLYTNATVQTCQCGCELAGGEETLPDLLHYMCYRYTIGLYMSCSSVTLCILHIAGGFQHTVRSTNNLYTLTLFLLTTCFL